MFGKLMQLDLIDIIYPQIKSSVIVLDVLKALYSKKKRVSHK